MNQTPFKAMRWIKEANMISSEQCDPAREERVKAPSRNPLSCSGCPQQGEREYPEMLLFTIERGEQKAKKAGCLEPA